MIWGYSDFNIFSRLYLVRPLIAHDYSVKIRFTKLVISYKWVWHDMMRYLQVRLEYWYTGQVCRDIPSTSINMINGLTYSKMIEECTTSRWHTYIDHHKCPTWKMQDLAHLSDHGMPGTRLYLTMVCQVPVSIWPWYARYPSLSDHGMPGTRLYLTMVCQVPVSSRLPISIIGVHWYPVGIHWYPTCVHWEGETNKSGHRIDIPYSKTFHSFAI